MGIEIQAVCRCGDIHFKAFENPIIQLCCHCTDCRESLKRDFAMIAFFKINAVEVSGNTVAKTFIANSGNQTKREACSSCGVVMFDKSEGFSSLIGVLAQQIGPPFMFNPSCHVWTSSKLSSVVVPEGITTYEKGIT